MTTCPSCQYENMEGAKWCTRCQTNLLHCEPGRVPGGSVVIPVRKERSPLVWGLSLIGSALLLVLAMLIVWTRVDVRMDLDRVMMVIALIVVPVLFVVGISSLIQAWHRHRIGRRSRLAEWGIQRYESKPATANPQSPVPTPASPASLASQNANSGSKQESAQVLPVQRPIPAKPVPPTPRDPPPNPETNLVRNRLWKNTAEFPLRPIPSSAPMETLGIESLIENLSDNHTEIRREAIERLAAKGAEARGAIPVLLALTVDIDATVRIAVEQTLKAIDSQWQMHPGVDPVLPTLIAALRDRNAQVVEAASKVLGKLGALAIPNLIDELDSPQDTIEKVYMMRLIGRNGPMATKAVPALIHGLKSQFPQSREAAAEALGSIGPGAKSAVPKLIEGLPDEFPDVRRGMARGLAGIGPPASSAIPPLLRLLVDRDDGVREAAAIALERIGPESIPKLVEIVQTRWLHRRAAFDTAVGTILGAYAKPPVDGVVWDPHRVIRNLGWTQYEAALKYASVEAAVDLALRVLGRFRAAAAVPVVLQLLDEPDSSHGPAAIRTLGQIGAAARCALPRLTQLLVHPAKVVREVARQALSQIDSQWAADPAVTVSIQRVASGLKFGPPIGEIAMDALCFTGPPAVPALINALDSGDRVAGEQAARVLCQLGSAATAAIPSLILATQRGHPWVQQAAARALKLIQPKG